jgi:uncharacterized iron-regulated membrane protein
MTVRAPAESDSQGSSGPGSGGFRQSMAWLHTWSGLALGWVLFFMFLTGTFGYLNSEVDRWMRPELPLSSAPPPSAELSSLAEQRLRALADGAVSWVIRLPVERSSPGFSVRWRGATAAGDRGTDTTEMLDTRTGVPLEDTVRETGGGRALYRMHYELHYLPEDWAHYLVGISTLFMLVAIATGVVVHKKIFRDFFTFRAGKGQRSWLDGHNVLSVTALPFHLMITWSGLIFFLFTYMPVAINTLYPEGPARERFDAEVFGREPVHASDTPSAPLVPLAPLVVEAERAWGTLRASLIEVERPGRAGSRISIESQRSRVVGSNRESLLFDGVTGQRLSRPAQPAAEKFRRTLLNLHEGHFSGLLLRCLYVLSALGGTAMVGSGLLLWSSKRKAKLMRSSERPGFGIAAVDVLNVGTIIGLPIGIAAYFWANRLIPVGIEGRGAWEIHALFLAWGATFVAASVRREVRAWVEPCCVAAAAYASLPLLNALTTERHLGVTLPAGDWVLAGFDLAALLVGLFFVWLARIAGRRQRHVATSPAAAARQTASPAAEVGG